jgi:prepilin-type N-terminal cleavage/methylation domain-containing protein
VSPASSSRTRPHRQQRAAAARAAGFTLVEILVVLVIVALISGSVMLAFQRILDVRLRIAQFIDGTDTPNLIAGWFRDSVAGMVPDVKGGADQFAGSQRSFTGLTVAPLNGMAGVPTRITWQLDYSADAGRTYLRYQSGDTGLTIASWPEDRGAIRYCAPDRACYDTWPPPQKTVQQVPSLIRLDIVKGTEAWPILAAPQSEHEGRSPLPQFGAQGTGGQAGPGTAGQPGVAPTPGVAPAPGAATAPGGAPPGGPQQ